MAAVPGIIGLFNKHVLKMSKKRVGSLLEFPFGGEDEDGLEGQEESLGGRARLWEAPWRYGKSQSSGSATVLIGTCPLISLSFSFVI